jgi:GAF domain-containing protein/CheY-like chemotaxis protein
MAEGKRTNAAAQARARIVELEGELAAQTATVQEFQRERDEAHEREQATAAVLRVISRSPEDLNASLQAIADTAAPLCRADFARVFLLHGDYLVAGPSGAPGGRSGGIQPGEVLGPISDLPNATLATASPVSPPLTDALQTGRTIHVADAERWGEERGWRPSRPDYPRTSLVIPLLRGSEAVGVIAFGRMDTVQPFSDREIALAETFADQAAIAVENARLFDELQARNREQAEALEREEATAEVLRVISRSPEDLDTSLQTVADTAARLCQADLTRVFLRDSDYLVAGPSGGPSHIEGPIIRVGDRLGPMTSEPCSPLNDAVLTARTIHAEDLLAYLREHGVSSEWLERSKVDSGPTGLRTHLAVPLLRGGDAIGVIMFIRVGAIRPFTAREIALAQTFADQAAIAVEKARLFQSIQERNKELTEALEREQATAEVLRVISRSPEDLDGSLQAVADTAARLCRVDFARVFLREEDYLVVGPSGAPQGWSGDLQPGERLGLLTDLSNSAGDALQSGNVAIDAVRSGRTIHAADVRQYAEEHGGRQTRLGTPRTALGVPLLRGSEAVGVIIFGRMGTVQPFDEREIALAETFADQAAIAVENARLFDELQARNREQAEALEREQATAEVLRVISRSPEDLNASLQAVADTATVLCRADQARLFLRDGDNLVAGPGGPPEGRFGGMQLGELLGRIPDSLDAGGDAVRTGNVAIDAVQTRRTVHAADTLRYTAEYGWRRRYPDAPRTALAVPLLRGSEAVGAIVFGRMDAVQPFSEREIAQAEMFADQAAIAVENARLFQDIQERNRELTEALEQQTATADVLRIISRSPVDLQMVLDTLVENAVRLSDAETGGMWRADGEYLHVEAFFSQDGSPRVTAIKDIHIDRGTIVGSAALGQSVLTNFAGPEEHLREYPASLGMVGDGIRARLAVPLVREGESVGVFMLARGEQGPFSEREVALVRTFADQAVIAMENARLFEELEQRNREQAEALEREQATAEVLRVISRSPEDLNASLQAVADTAARLCGASWARVHLRDGDHLVRGPSSAGAQDDLLSRLPIGSRGSIDQIGTAAADAVRTKNTVHTADYVAYLREHDADEALREQAALNDQGAIPALGVPMLRGDEAVGVLRFQRHGGDQPFSAREIALAETFADQAAIAVENARLFQGIQERNKELTEALEQQTTTADVLRIISRAPVELQAVLTEISESAARLCDAPQAAVFMFEAGAYRSSALYNIRRQSLGRGRASLSRDYIPDRAALERKTLHVVGELTELESTFPGSVARLQKEGLERVAYLVVPLLRGGEPTGVLVLRRQEARPFTDKQTAVAEMFANQAVIAMENARLFDELQARNREQAEALEREQATAEVLRVISRSPEDLDGSLQAVADTAARLCRVDFARIFLREGDYLVAGPSGAPQGWSGNYRPGERLGPLVGLSNSAGDALQSGGVAIDAIRSGRTIHAADTRQYAEEHGWQQRPGGPRTALAVPLLRGSEAVGVIVFGREGTVQPFAEGEIALAETFADQAAIAVENARLFQDIQERNRELTEALEQQTATADVLRIISRSPVELQTVLDTLVENAVRLCDAEGGMMWSASGDRLRSESEFGLGTLDRPAIDDLPLDHGNLSGRAALEQTVVTHYGSRDDLLRDFPRVPPLSPAGIEVHARLAVPLVREGESIGVFVLVRREEREFGEREIALVRTFADQAVIAMENARLFAELEERNREQTEALEREEATAEVLRVISRSPEDLDASLQAVADTAARLCHADFARVFLREEDYLVAGPSGAPQGRVGDIQLGERLGPLTDLSNAAGDAVPSGYTTIDAIQSRRTVHAADSLRYAEDHRPSVALQGWRATHSGGPRTTLAVPLLRGSEAVGVIVFGRMDAVQPFDEREIALAEMFADQAAIAVLNARLLRGIQERNRELTEALEQQTATADVLKAISRSPVELQTVLQTLAENAARLCDAEVGVLGRFVEGRSRVAAVYGAPDEVREYMETMSPTPPSNGGPLILRMLAQRRTVHVTDVYAEPGIQQHIAPLLGHRYPTRLTVPLWRDGDIIGHFGLWRDRMEPFTERQVELVETFADQAVIAMENARLFAELEGRTRELETASRAKSEFLSRMSHELRTPLNAIIGFAEIMEMDPATTARQHDRVHHILGGGQHLLGLINEVLDITRIEAGRLSLSPEPVQLDAVIQEVLDLERPLAAEAEVSLDIEEPETFRLAVQADRQRLRQIVLNLVANAVKYNRRGGSVTLVCAQQAAGGSSLVGTARTDGDASDTDQGQAPPPVRVDDPHTRPGGERVRLTVRDTGPGIPAEQIGRLFAPFERLSADMTGVEGTGLGLAIARGLAEAMDGAIGVESTVGEGSSFWVELPRAELPARATSEGMQDAALQGVDDAPQVSATVLYIEDNQPNVDLVQEALKFRPGITLLTAPDGATGIRIARRYQPALILLDLNLPELQGDEVLARLRADDRTAAVPVVMVSADATKGQIDRLLAAGARDYLTKPLDVKRLLAIVDEIVTTSALSSSTASSAAEAHEEA